MMIYLDNSAGTKPYPEVIETITDVLTNNWGNASADNSFGKDAMAIINNVTQQVADDINCNSDELIWTSGACEANSLAITGFFNTNSDFTLCTTKMEHTSVTRASRAALSEFQYLLSNDNCGFIKLDVLEKTMQLIRNNYDYPFVSVSFANSEIGTIQDIKAISAIVHKYNGIIHVDATQMYPWYKIDVRDLGIDLMSVSGQKMHCVKGVGFLFVRDGIKLDTLIHGSQQNERRGGSYPTHLIAAFGKALEIIRQNNETSAVKDLRDYLLSKLLMVKGVSLNGPETDSLRLPNNISLTIDGVKAETLVTMCDLMGIIIAKGSACKSYEPTPSETLLAIGLTPEQAMNTIRISLGDFSSLLEIDTAANIITKLIERIRHED